MPSIAFIRKSSFPADNMSIDIAVTHTIVLGQASPSVRTIKRWTTPDMETTLDSGFSITMSGSLNGVSISDDILATSTPFLRLQEYLDRQAQELGFDGAFIDTQESCFKLKQADNYDVKSLRRLVNLRVHCAWKVNSPALGPFSRLPFLPFESLYAQALEDIVSTNCTRHYPLIFGRLRYTIATDSHAFASASKSVMKILHRASSETSRDGSKMIKAIRKNLRAQHRTRVEQTQHHLGIIDLDHSDILEYAEPDSAQDVIQLALQRFAEMTLSVPLTKKRRVRAIEQTVDIFASEDEGCDASQEQTPTEELLMENDDDASDSSILYMNEDLIDDQGLSLFNSSSPLLGDTDGDMLFTSGSENGASDSSMLMDHDDICDHGSISNRWDFTALPTFLGTFDHSDVAQHQALFNGYDDETASSGSVLPWEHLDSLDNEHESHRYFDARGFLDDLNADPRVLEDEWPDW